MEVCYFNPEQNFLQSTQPEVFIFLLDMLPNLNYILPTQVG